MSTTLPRPHSAVFDSPLPVLSLPNRASTYGLGLQPGPSRLSARARPKSQTFRSSPLAGPAISISELIEKDRPGAKDKGKQQCDCKGPKESRRPVSMRARTAPAAPRVTLAELGAVRTKAGVAFPHKRPASIIDLQTSTSERCTSSGGASLRPPRVPFASESNNVRAQPDTSTSPSTPTNTHTLTQRSKSSNNLDPEHHWLTAAQTPVFSRTQIYTQNVIMPVRAPPCGSRKSTSASTSTFSSTSSSSSSSRSGRSSASGGSDGASGGRSGTTTPSDSLSRKSSYTSLSSSIQGGVNAVPLEGDGPSTNANANANANANGSRSSEMLSFEPRRKSVAKSPSKDHHHFQSPSPNANAEEQKQKQLRHRTLSERLSVLVRTKSTTNVRSAQSDITVLTMAPEASEASDAPRIVDGRSLAESPSPIEDTADADAHADTDASKNVVNVKTPLPFAFLKEDPAAAAAAKRPSQPSPSPAADAAASTSTSIHNYYSPSETRTIKKRLSAQLLGCAVKAKVPSLPLSLPRRRKTISAATVTNPDIRISPAAAAPPPPSDDPALLSGDAAPIGLPPDTDVPCSSPRRSLDDVHDESSVPSIADVSSATVTKDGEEAPSISLANGQTDSITTIPPEVKVPDVESSSYPEPQLSDTVTRTKQKRRTILGLPRSLIARTSRQNVKEDAKTPDLTIDSLGVIDIQTSSKEELIVVPPSPDRSGTQTHLPPPSPSPIVAEPKVVQATVAIATIEVQESEGARTRKTSVLRSLVLTSSGLLRISKRASKKSA